MAGMAVIHQRATSCRRLKESCTYRKALTLHIVELLCTFMRTAVYLTLAIETMKGKEDYINCNIYVQSTTNLGQNAVMLIFIRVHKVLVVATVKAIIKCVTFVYDVAVKKSVCKLHFDLKKIQSLQNNTHCSPVVIMFNLPVL
jgi:hypothetical protein